jgi:hypothetical protein
MVWEGREDNLVETFDLRKEIKEPERLTANKKVKVSFLLEVFVLVGMDMRQ